MNSNDGDHPVVIFAGGGSGGHISPALAIHERLIELEPSTQSVFLCSTRAIDSQMLGETKVKFVSLPASPPSIKPLAAARFLRNFYKSKVIGREVIKEHNANCLIALGGFVAAPAVSAANTCGIPVMLVNLDSPPGKANRWIAKRCDHVLSAIELPTMPRFTSEVVGMPIRRRAIATQEATTCRNQLGLDPNINTLFVTGASQGATSINSFMKSLADTQPEILEGWQVLHLSGHGSNDDVRLGYESRKIRAVVKPFIHEIGAAWGAADLAISRAGANSVAEAAHNAVPTLFLPYPYHKDRHQWNNAQPLVDIGGAVIEEDRINADDNTRLIGPVLRELMCDKFRRDQMRESLQAMPLPDAAMTIARKIQARMRAGNG